ncbi:serine protease [Flavobacterium pectinovorum]|uniref:S1 family peptidase n=1 Tax=Flavobacterium pectinovorum TaxID=29533 RepID=UPI001FACCFBA|nr:serine protease [Flavobacterium pectinovorum]MCI9845591.1 trypsin-like peptidase domain-containing protein [Flavobacterium pectinovorum]
MNKTSLEAQRHFLMMKAVHIQCLDENKNPLKNVVASGFIVQEGEDLFLYTCWHVVTSYNMHNIEVGRQLPNRKFLEINLQNKENPNKGVELVSGNQNSVIPLYDKHNTPLWIQEKQDSANYSLNCIGIKVPFLHDVIKLLLPKNMQLSQWQVITKDYTAKKDPFLGEKIHIVGYPYGYSALGLEQPIPIVVTRFIASYQIKDRHREMLIDGPASPGMSGGPVFVERNDNLQLIGIYTGLLYPDHIIEQNEKTTALGTICPLTVWWANLEMDAVQQKSI